MRQQVAISLLSGPTNRRHSPASSGSLSRVLIQKTHTSVSLRSCSRSSVDRLTTYAGIVESIRQGRLHLGQKGGVDLSR
jgi:hypothetical protein